MNGPRASSDMDLETSMELWVMATNVVTGQSA